MAKAAAAQERTHNLQVLIEPSEVERLQRWCDDHYGVSLSQAVRLFIRERLDQWDVERPKNRKTAA